MIASTILAGLGLASVAAAAGQNVVYWGATNNESNDLTTYCSASAGIDILVLSFLDVYGATGSMPSGVMGDCYVGTDGKPQLCDDLAAAISTCQAAGVKIIVSLGGYAGSYSVTSQDQATAIGEYLWNAYGNSGNTTVPRPFGDVVIDGFDFDIEVNYGSEYYQYIIEAIRAGYATDSSKTYYITGAPQCPIPEPNMGEIISSSQFDYLWVQFYNNNPVCSLGLSGDGPFNFDDWVSFLATTPSKDAKLFIGAPASELASNGNAGGAVYYASPEELSSIVASKASNPAFGGVMMWDAGYSDSNTANGCNYAQNVKSILTKGSPC